MDKCPAEQDRYVLRSVTFSVWPFFVILSPERSSYGLAKPIKLLVRDVDFLLQQKGSHDLMWKRAYMAPHRFADVFDQRILVILDEFQNLAGNVYRDEKCEGKPDESMPGSFHSVVESKVAPMLVTGAVSLVIGSS